MFNPEAKLAHCIVDIFTGETITAYSDRRIADRTCEKYNEHEGFQRYAVVSRYY